MRYSSISEWPSDRLPDAADEVKLPTGEYKRFGSLTVEEVGALIVEGRKAVAA